MQWGLFQYLDVYSDFCRLIKRDVELRARIDQRLAMLEAEGNQLGEPVCRYIENGVLECKAKSAQHQARLLFCFQPEKRIVILLCVLKDQRKLDRADIAEAARRKSIIEAEAERIRGLHSTH